MLLFSVGDESGLLTALSNGLADLGLQIGVQMFKRRVETMVLTLDPADQHSAFEPRNQDGSDLGRVDTWPDGPGRNAFYKNLFQRRPLVSQRLTHLFAQYRIAIV